MTVCARCRVAKPDSEFSRNARKRNGLSSYCKPCAVAQTREWRSRNRDSLLARRRGDLRAKERARARYVPKPARIKVCAQCGASFESKRAGRLCGAECRRIVANRRRVLSDRVTQRQLGAYQRRKARRALLPRGGKPVCISPQCEASRMRGRLTCQAHRPYLGTRPLGPRYRSRNGTQTGHSPVTPKAWSRRICDTCGEAFIPTRATARRCSATCRKRAQRRKDDLRHLWNRRAIYERDNWTCWLCGDPVDPSLDTQHPMSPTLDHVYPRALGGGRTQTNLRLAHRVCNSVKGVRVLRPDDFALECSPANGCEAVGGTYPLRRVRVA